ncbi:MAG: SDR family oxidoreductase [Candidatus Neomarinimicrobiota bacterium]
MNKKPKVILVTGASSGIGRATALRLARAGHRVYGSSRRLNSVDTDRNLPAVKMLEMDVNSSASVRSAVTALLDEAGRLDTVINNAGFGICGPAELTSTAEAKAQFDTNFFGVQRVCRAVIPVLRQQAGGQIINISSLGGLIGLPYQGFYSASKFALEGFSEALYQELRPQGIRVVLVEPGDFSTGFTGSRRRIERVRSEPDLYPDFPTVLKVIEADETGGKDPDKVARLIERIIACRNPRLRYRVGAWDQKISILVKKLLPDKLFAAIIAGHYRLGQKPNR